MAARSVLIALVLTAALMDLRWRRIPNWLTGAGLALGVAARAYESGWAGLWNSLLGAGLAFAVYVGLFALRAMGGGDVKLMTAVGACAGPMAWLTIFILASIVGGALALASVATKGEFTRVGRNVGVILWELLHFRAPHKADASLDVASPAARTLPHGVAIAIAALLWAASALRQNGI